MHRGLSVATIILSVTTLSVALAGCGAGDDPGDPPASPPAPPQPVGAARADLAARAAAAKDLVAVSVYRLTRPAGVGAGAAGEVAVMVVRAADRTWRVDVPGGALAGSADVAVASVGDGLYQCVLPPSEPACVRLERLTPEVDPRVPHVFTDWLDVLTDRAAALAVSAAPALPNVTGACFSVEPSAASLEAPVDPGVYCYETDGTLTGADLELGALRLVSTDPAAPATVELPAPVVAGEPLPTASPPAPTPTPGPTPSGATGSGSPTA